MAIRIFRFGAEHAEPILLFDSLAKGSQEGMTAIMVQSSQCLLEAAPGGLPKP